MKNVLVSYHLVGETPRAHGGPDDGLDVPGDLVQVEGGVDVAVRHQVVGLPPDGPLDLGRELNWKINILDQFSSDL